MNGTQRVISGAGLPTTAAFGRECSQQASTQQGGARGTQFSALPLFVHSASLPCPALAERRQKRVRKLG